MSALNDRTGQRCGALTVHRREPNNTRGRSMWLCICDCGVAVSVTGINLQSRNSKSCGCQKSMAVAKARFKHGHSRRRLLNAGPSSREYNSWCGMIGRCTNDKNHKYPSYGGRGIKVCDRWQYGEGGRSGFECFLADMGPRPLNTSIDRFPDNDGNYEKSNCRWGTPKQQYHNRERRQARASHVD